MNPKRAKSVKKKLPVAIFLAFCCADGYRNATHLGRQAGQIAKQYVVPPLRPEKTTCFDKSFFHRYKSLRDFRNVPLELDMPDGSICCLTTTRFISYRVLSKAKNISILRSKNIEQTKFAYRLFRISACYDCLKPSSVSPMRVFFNAL